jgi:hypothetical protein
MTMPRQPKTHRVVSTTSAPTENLARRIEQHDGAIENWGRAASGWIVNELRPGPTSAPGIERLKRLMAELGDDYPGDQSHKNWIKRFGAKRSQYYLAYREHREDRPKTFESKN